MESSDIRNFWLKKLGRKLLESSSAATQEHSYRSDDSDQTAPSGAPPLPKREACPTQGLLGAGGMGEVFRARQAELERNVAVKKLRRERQTPIARTSFLAEAVVTGQLEHPNIVPVYALAVDPDDEIFLTMKLVDGQTWQTLIRDTRRGDLPFHLEILNQVCNAVAFAHSKHIIHNDLKPSNVMVGAFGEVTVLDWGLAVSDRPVPDGVSRVRHKSKLQTPVGTPAYMAPELALGCGDQLGPGTDVYLLGAVLFELLAGHAPHRMRTLGEAIDHAARGALPPLPIEAPEELRRICTRALARLPADRFESVKEFQRELRQYTQHRESLTLSARAEENLAACDPAREDHTRLYDEFAVCIGGFAQARALWEDNPHARDGEQRARVRFGKAALQHGDLGLAHTQLELARERALPAPDPELAALETAIAARRAALARAHISRQRLRTGLRVAASALVCALLAGLLGSVWANREIESRNQALEVERALVLAQRDTIAREKGNAEKRGAIAEQALEKLAGDVQNKLSGELGSERAQRVAQSLLRFSLEGWQQLRDADVASQRSTRGSARVRIELGSLLGKVYGAFDEALVELRAAEATLLTLLPASPDGAGQDLLKCRTVLAWTLAQTGELAAARELLEAGLPAAEALAARSPPGMSTLLSLRNMLATTYIMLALPAQALPLLEANIDARAAAHSSGLAPELVRDLAADLLLLANCQRSLGQIEAARVSLAHALEVGERDRQLDPDNWLHGDRVATTREQIAEMVANNGDSERAAALLAPAIEHWRARIRIDPDNSFLARKLLSMLIISAKIHSVSRQPELALAPIEEAVGFADGLCSYPFPSISLLELRWDAYMVHGDALSNCGSYTEARQVYLAALALLSAEGTLHETEKRARLLVELGANAALCGLADASLEHLIEGLGLLEELERGEDLERCRADAYLGLARLSPAESRPLLEQALLSYQRCLQIDPQNVLTLSKWAPVAIGVAEFELADGALDAASARFVEVFERLGKTSLAESLKYLRVNAAQHHMHLEAQRGRFPDNDDLWNSGLRCARELAGDPEGPAWAQRALFDILEPMARMRESRGSWHEAEELLRERRRVAVLLREQQAADAGLVWWANDALIRLSCLRGDFDTARELCTENLESGISPAWDRKTLALIRGLAGDTDGCAADLQSLAAADDDAASWLAAFSGDTGALAESDASLAGLLDGTLAPASLLAEQPEDEDVYWFRRAHVLVGIVYERQGARDEARTHYERCRALGGPWDVDLPMRWALTRLRQWGED